MADSSARLAPYPMQSRTTFASRFWRNTRRRILNRSTASGFFNTPCASPTRERDGATDQPPLDHLGLDRSHHRSQGEGVIGHQPILAPGESFKYSSCVRSNAVRIDAWDYQMLRTRVGMFDIEMRRSH